MLIKLFIYLSTDEESGDDEMLTTLPAGCQDELSQLTPPKRRKLAARRRRHPAGSHPPTLSEPMVSSIHESKTNCGCASSGMSNNQAHHIRPRRQCVNRPRRRRRTSTFATTSTFSPSLPFDTQKDLFSPVDGRPKLDNHMFGKSKGEIVDDSTAFVPSSSSLSWFMSNAANESLSNGVSDSLSTLSSAYISNVTRTTNLSLGESSNPVTPGSSCAMLDRISSDSTRGGNPTLMFMPSATVSRDQRRELQGSPGRFSSRDHEHRHPFASSTATSSTVANSDNVPDFFASNTRSSMLHNLRTNQSPLQFNLGDGMGAIESRSSRDRHSGGGSSRQHRFTLSHQHIMTEVLGRRPNPALTFPSTTSNGHNGGQSPDEEHLSLPVLPLCKSRRFYRFRLGLSRCNAVVSLKIRFDRLALLSLFDRNVSLWDSLLGVTLALTVGVLTALVLIPSPTPLLQDAFAFLFCVVSGSCQYSLLKSVQPDAASPTHGHNRMVAFGRPVYFCLLVSLVLVANQCINHQNSWAPISLYGVNWGSVEQMTLMRNVLLNLVLCFPIIFCLGLMPQISTFVIYLLGMYQMFKYTLFVYLTFYYFIL